MTEKLRKRYPKEMKEVIINRMMPPNNEAISRISEETGITEMTLYKVEERSTCSWKCHTRGWIRIRTMEQSLQSIVEKRDYIENKLKHDVILA